MKKPENPFPKTLAEIGKPKPVPEQVLEQIRRERGARGPIPNSSTEKR